MLEEERGKQTINFPAKKEEHILNQGTWGQSQAVSEETSSWVNRELRKCHLKLKVETEEAETIMKCSFAETVWWDHCAHLANGIVAKAYTPV